MSASELKKELRKQGDPQIAAHSQRFFKTGAGEYGEGDKFLGIRVPVLRRFAKEFRQLTLHQARQVLISEYHEERLCALFILVDKYARGDDQEKTAIFDLYLNNTRYINNWDLVDSSAPRIVGAHLFDADRQLLFELAVSDSLWERRIAVMSTFFFIRQNDFDITFKLAERLINDPEDLIHKAVGWMLREVGNRNGKAERAFLKKHYREMPRTMLRYAIEKFPVTERKRILNGNF